MTVDANSVHLSMPFAKVDKVNRLVSGYATLNNIDSQGDIVLADASAKAFARARGNLREMHQPIAVGKVVDFREQEFYDTESQEFYRGIFVTARVSEGAEDTWKKVLDETLTGFSIGGEIKEVSNEFVKEAGKTVRFIKDYDLVELSLVDNPANQLANVFSIQKSDSGDTFVKGMLADTEIDNVFICTEDDTVVVKNTDSEECPMCGLKMENAGWFEAGANRAEKVQAIVTKFRNPAVQEAAPTITHKGGVEVATTVTKSDSEPVPHGKETSVPNPSEETPTGEKLETEAKATVEDEAAEVDETAGTEGEETVSPEEVTDEETEISKKIDDLHDAVKKSLEESKEQTLEKVKDLETKIDQALEKASELEKQFEGFGQKLEAQKSRLTEFENRLEKINSADAIKKSADVSTENQKSKDETFWGGSFI